MSLATTSPTQIGDAVIDAIARELEHLQEDLLFTEKAHFTAASRARRTHLVLGSVAAVASGTSAASIVAQTQPLLSGSLALLGSITAVLLTFLKPEQASQQHLNAGRELAAIRVQARQVRELDVREGADSSALRRRVARLADQKADADRAAPTISDRDFERARRKIQSGVFQHAP